MSDEKIPSGRAARIACCSCVSARSIDNERPVRFRTSGPSTFHAYCRVWPDGRSPENALRAFIESSLMFMLNVFRQRPLPGRVRTSMRGPPLPLPEASSYRMRTS